MLSPKAALKQVEQEQNIQLFAILAELAFVNKGGTIEES